jgi:hypothetical protein
VPVSRQHRRGGKKRRIPQEETVTSSGSRLACENNQDQKPNSFAKNVKSGQGFTYKKDLTEEEFLTGHFLCTLKTN